MRRDLHDRLMDGASDMLTRDPVRVARFVERVRRLLDGYQRQLLACSATCSPILHAHLRVAVQGTGELLADAAALLREAEQMPRRAA